MSGVCMNALSHARSTLSISFGDTSVWWRASSSTHIRVTHAHTHQLTTLGSGRGAGGRSADMAPADATAKEAATVTTGSLVWVPAPAGDASDRAWLKAEVLKVAPGGSTALVRDEDGREVDVDAVACPLQNPAARMGVEVRREWGGSGGARHALRLWLGVGLPERRAG